MRIELAHVVVDATPPRRASCAIAELAIPCGSAVCLQGPSGSGKSTLLDVIAGVLSVTRGRVQLGEVDLGTLSPRERDRYRTAHVAYVFQTFNVFAHLTALENVALGLTLRGTSRREARAQARRWLERMDLGAVDAPCGTLSVGERQRVALARALAWGPAVLLADEPTASLDARRRDAFLDQLERRAPDTTLLVATHDEAVARRFSERVATGDVMRWSEP